jgi:hypothetical protein
MTVKAEHMVKFAPRLLLIVAACLLTVKPSIAQLRGQTRITQAINEADRSTLRGNTHPLARPAFDQGVAPDDLLMDRMLLVLKRSPQQDSELRALLDAQQDKSSPNYHQWLTPDQFGQQFGPVDQDIQTVRTWLESHGFRVTRISRGHIAIEFSGTAGQVREAFGTEIHSYVMNRESHWANASDPQIPSALVPVVAGVNSFHNFFTKAQHRVAGVFSRSQTTGEVRPVNPQFTYPSNNCIPGCFAVGPYDFATIYNVLPLWNTQPAIDGTGQTIAVVARSNINIQDVRDFRNLFGLQANDPQIVLDGPDPGLVPGDETESDLDLEWAGAIATGAAIKLVVSAPTETQDGVDLSALYIVDNNLAPVMSESYGECELFAGTAGNAFRSNLMEQAAAQGITVMVSDGDYGSADCDLGNVPSSYGAAVNGLASTPFNVAVGGTDFLNFGTNFDAKAPSPYWNQSNGPHGVSAKGYIPEMPWNDSCSSPALLSLQPPGTTAEANCNGYFVYPTIGGGGGASNCIGSDGQTVASCTGGYAKPSWQTGAGVPADNSRDLPDLSLFSSEGFIDSFYIVCEADAEPNSPTCNLDSPYTDFLAIGGTSVSAPAFAGVMALVNQLNNPGSGVGNANYVLYKLPALASQAGLNCNSSLGPDSKCIFNDVTLGTIAMPCRAGTPDCVQNTPKSDTFGVGLLAGMDAGPSYDRASGLGTPNIANLVRSWDQATFTASTTTLSLNNGNAVNITHGQSIPVNVTVSGAAGTPTGDVSLIATPAAGASQGIQEFTLVAGSASGATNLLPGGAYSVLAHYEGDSTYGGSYSNAVTVNVGKEASAVQLAIETLNLNNGSLVNPNATTVPYGSPYVLRAQVTNASSTSCSPGPTRVVACPTGNVTLTDNGNPLDAGTYTLNTNGYFEDTAIQLGGGIHTLAASYAGDNSFAPSTAPPLNITVTPAEVNLNPDASNFQPSIGSTVTLSLAIYTESNGAAPTGTVTFFNGAAQIGNPVPVTAVPADPALGAPYVGGSASFTTSQLPVGNNEITMRYSGDSNYIAAQTGEILVDVLIPTKIEVTASNSDVSQGTPVSVTVRVIPSQPNGPAIAGSILLMAESYGAGFSFPEENVSNGQVQYTANGTSPYLPTGSYALYAQYYSDGNYAAGSGSTQVTVTPRPGTDFAFGNPSPQMLTIPAPGAFPTPVTIPVNAVNGFSGTVIFPQGTACSISPAGSQAMCQVNPAYIVGSGSLTINIFTTAPSGAAAIQRNRPVEAAWWSAIGILGLAVLVMAFSWPTSQRRPKAVLGLVALSLFGIASLGCGSGSVGGNLGGNSGGGSGGNVGTPTGVVYTVTVTGTCTPLTHSTSFAFTVQ